MANEDVEMKDEDSDVEVKPKIKKQEDVDSKENVKPGGGRCLLAATNYTC